MLKKSICILLAALCVFALCACKKTGEDDRVKPDSASNTADNGASKPAATAVPAPAETGNYTVPADDNAPVADEDSAKVLLTFNGLVEAEVTAGQLKELEFYEYSDSSDDDTPAYSGPLVRDVLKLIGAENAVKITIKYDAVDVVREFVLADVDLEKAMFAVIRDGEVMSGGSVFICPTADGFNYIINVDTAYTIE